MKRYSDGMLKYILLGFLNYASMTGYDLKTIMDYTTMHFWHAYHSQIYTTLRKLESDGLLESEVLDGDDKLNRRLYTITAEGQEVLTSWLQQSLTELPTNKDDLLVRLFFSAQRDPEAVLNELRFQRQLHQQKLVYYETLREAALRTRIVGQTVSSDYLQRDVQFWSATLKFGKSYEQNYIRWLDEVIALLEAE